MLSRDGKPLATVAFERQDWYLERGLATLVDYPDKRYSRVIQLTFQHKGTDIRETDIVCTENRCVVCGRRETMSLHHVVPYRVKRLYPARLKENTRHQCVLVCTEHHIAAEVEAAKVPDPHQAFNRFAQRVTATFSWFIGRCLRKPFFWAWQLKHGSISTINRRYIDAFMRLKPQYLPKGWLQ